MWLIALAGFALADDVDVESLVNSIELPGLAERIRSVGTSDGDVRDALEQAKEKGLSPGETADVMTEVADAAEEHGPVDNFGAFVGARLDEGLRGRELAAAIREQHGQSGKGRSHSGRPEHAGGPSGGQDTHDSRGRGASDAGRGRSADRPQDGRPDEQPEHSGTQPADTEDGTAGSPATRSSDGEQRTRGRPVDAGSQRSASPGSQRPERGERP